MSRQDYSQQQKLELAERDLAMIEADLARDWVTIGLEAGTELERPELVSVDDLNFAPAYDVRPPAVEIDH